MFSLILVCKSPLRRLHQRAELPYGYCHCDREDNDHHEEEKPIAHSQPVSVLLATSMGSPNTITPVEIPSQETVDTIF